MFGIGMPELLVILGLALLLIGPKKLPQLAKSLGKTMGELRKASDDLKDTISEEIKPIKDEIPDKGALEKALKKQFSLYKSRFLGTSPLAENGMQGWTKPQC